MILEQLISNKKAKRKSLAVLIDPDKVSDVASVKNLVNLCVENYVDFLFIGGSLMANDKFSQVVNIAKSNCNIPVVIFPGHHIQIDSKADAILLLSLISGRNPEFLIGQHVHAAPILKKSKIEILSVGYMLVSSGAPTSASYMSNTVPIPSDKPTIAACTAMAGEMLGLKSIYLDAGSGAESPVPQKIISRVARSIGVPLIVGGGLNSSSRINLALEAGADMIVLGNGIEKDHSLLVKASEKILEANQALNIN